jgi:uncharacterized protein YkwD
MQGKNIIRLKNKGIAHLLSGILLLFFNGSGYSQQPKDTIKPESLNEVLLQQLILQQIDSIRKAEGVQKLESDTILTKAAKDQSAWMLNNDKVSHSQPGPSKKTVNKRVEYYGGKGYLCGENTASTYVHELMMVRKNRKQQYYNYTYQELADELISLWYGSEDHYQNIINPYYGFTGIWIMVNPVTHRVFAAQVFGYKAGN